jgi:ABC-type enterochelin transport system substrate-binding protein
MLANKLKINDKKTELLILGGKAAINRLNSLSPSLRLEVKVGNEIIKPSTAAKNLGAIFDEHMSM